MAPNFSVWWLGEFEIWLGAYHFGFCTKSRKSPRSYAGLNKTCLVWMNAWSMKFNFGGSFVLIFAFLSSAI